MNKNKLLVITGATATGKTRLAALVADRLDGEIISADSRQVYKGMDIGTGKDYEDYQVNGKQIPFHLVDIVEAGYEYNVYEFQKEFIKTYQEINEEGRLPILCGGTGMYIESVLAGYRLSETPVNEEFRLFLKDKSTDEVSEMLKKAKPLHNTTDLIERERIIRALEIYNYEQTKQNYLDFTEINFTIFAIHFERELIRNRITERLQKRLENGMIDEIANLLKSGLTPDQLKFYGLEYRFITMYLNNEITYYEMFRLLNIAIHQFAKRQMTWFRRMEKKGFEINWIDGNLSDSDKLQYVITHFKAE